MPESRIDKCIGTWDTYELDPTDDTRRTITFQVYSLKNVAPRQAVAMRVENAYYAYECNLVTSARTLGELMGQVDLPSLMALDRFSENGARPADAHFSLDDNDFIWEVLADCEDAPLMEGEEPS